MLNIGRVLLVLNETNTDVHMYISRIYSSRDLDTLLYKVGLDVYWNYTGLYTNITIDKYVHFNNLFHMLKSL